jgi:Na+-transporting NADH:ubiquinone oxidoreductase subunit NqrF
MSRRLLLSLILPAVLLAFALSGCSSTDPSTESLNENAGKKVALENTAAAKAATRSGKRASSQTTTAPSIPKFTAKTGLQNCLTAAKQLPSASDSRAAQKQCRTSFGADNKDIAKKVQSNINKAMAQARAQCRESVKNIPDATARRNALKTCAKFK